MAEGLNRAELIGHLGQDPEIKYTQSGAAVVNLSIATNERRKTDGQWEDYTEWHRAVVWGKTAESCNEYLRKGSQVYIEGRLQTRKWADRDGVDRYTTEINAQRVLFLSKQGNTGGGSYNGGGNDGIPSGGNDGIPSGDAPSGGSGDPDIPF